ncbi:hypothetical protein LTR48_003507 [Friedmanniomyces endolithicus]|uniref:BD-FAE-like domain-containing protein n=1 Tax=Rachicladosporium monterosium TaxID=1507873 RepID=A0ABR0L845_9PEZI|nr:hypothetical protein LTR48_003507 [Friedmanniomyces endolithicus]KAK5144467.1 hypothetical protein LTR32_003618 [Rachicladosporium monterosium]
MAPPSPKRRTFTYKKVNTLEIPLDFYPPDSAHNVPILIWFHGGGLLQGKRSSVSPHMLRAVHAHNLALVSADYRLAPQVGIAEIYEDVRDCIAFIRNKLPQLAGEGVLDASRLAEANLGSLLKVKAGDDNWRVAKKIYEYGLPPAYVVHGDADTAVGVDQADEVVGVMVGCGMEVVYERLRGVNHLFDKEESVGMEQMYEWMMKRL